MVGAGLIWLGFDLGWRGYGMKSHLVVALAFVAAMSVFTLFTSFRQAVVLVPSYAGMAALFEIIFMLPGWGLGLGARRLLGGGKPYSLKMSFDV